jgi:hypothetical protein
MSNQYPTSTTTSARSGPSRRKWFIDLQIRKHDRLAVATTTTANNDNTLATISANNNLLLIPVGYSEQKVADVTPQEDDDRLLARRSWDIALQPIKQLPMNMILAWMAGNTFSLMSIMIVVMLFMKPIQVNRVFFSRNFSLFLFFLFSQYFLLVQHSHH